MRIIGIYIINNENKKYVCVKNLGFVSYFNRNPVAEIMTAFACDVANRIESNERKIFEHNDYMFACLKHESIVVIIITDNEYPSRVTFSLIQNLFNNPTQQNAQHMLETCQDARQIDKIYDIRASLDETMVVMHQTIDKILERGEKLDDLVERSAQLSLSSKMFYKTARQHNRCCKIS